MTSSALTRRGFAAALAAPALAQNAANPPADELTAARQFLRANVEQMVKTKVPMSVEPAFQFKV